MKNSMLLMFPSEPLNARQGADRVLVYNDPTQELQTKGCVNSHFLGLKLGHVITSAGLHTKKNEKYIEHVSPCYHLKLYFLEKLALKKVVRIGFEVLPFLLGIECMERRGKGVWTPTDL
jgi:hypothetical protein